MDKKEIDQILVEHTEAVNEMLIASKLETESKAIKIKAQKRFSLAREALHSIEFN